MQPACEQFGTCARATEAQEAGVALQDIAEHAQHSNVNTPRVGLPSSVSRIAKQNGKKRENAISHSICHTSPTERAMSGLKQG